jgi:hypothetical protein
VLKADIVAVSAGADAGAAQMIAQGGELFSAPACPACCLVSSLAPAWSMSSSRRSSAATCSWWPKSRRS